MEYKMKEEKVADLIHYAQNKDISSLNLVDEHEYRQGLERMEHALKKDPAIKVVNELAEIFFLAKKKWNVAQTTYTHAAQCYNIF